MRIIFILLSFWSAWAYSATMVYNDGCETGSGSSVDTAKWEVHTDPVGTSTATFSRITSDKVSGSYSCQAYLQAPPASGGVYTGSSFRAESYLAAGKGDLAFNTEYWIGWNFNYKSYPADNSSEFSPFQLHRRPSSWDPACGGEASAYSVAPFYIYINNDVMYINTLGAINRYSESVRKNEWQSIVFHINIGWSSTNYIEAWKNGVKLFSFTGPNHAGPYDDCGLPFRSPYINVGIYKWPWKLGRTQTTASQRSLLIDNFKVASGVNGYDDVYTPVSVSTDTTDPVPSGLTEAPTSNSAVITWTTDEPADSSIDYGTSAGVYTQTITNAALVTSHSVTITGLTPGTTYHYRFRTKDAAGNEYIGSNHPFTTLSSSTPEITNEADTNITSTTATITWDTVGVPSDSYVYYGTTAALASNTGSATLVTAHSVTLTGLSAKTHYFRKVCSTSAAPVTTCGPITTFNTKTTSGLFSDLFSFLEPEYSWH